MLVDVIGNKISSTREYGASIRLPTRQLQILSRRLPYLRLALNAVRGVRSVKVSSSIKLCDPLG